MIKKMTKKRATPWLLLAVILFALFIRLYQVGSLPKILNRDEAALAYNAHLLLETGRDEWGKHWPLSLKSFGDYKLPGYVYTLVGLFKFLDKSDLVVRLPSVLAGISLAWLAYHFAKELNLSLRFRLILAGLVATTPVFIFFSRMAFEANLALSFLLGSLVLLLKKHDLPAVLLMSLAVLTYNTPLLLLPFIIITIPFLRSYKKVKSWWLPVLGLSLVLVMSGLQLLLLSSQKSNITIFQDETAWRQSVAYRQQFTGWQQTIFGHRYAYYLRLMANNYLQSFSPQFLVLGQGGHPWHSISEVGHLYVVVYGLALIGIVVGLGEGLLGFADDARQERKLKIWLLYLTVVSLLPAVVTVDAPHATRSLLFFFLLLVWAAIGFQKIDRLIFRERRHIWLWLVVILVAVETGGYLQAYFGRYRQQQQALKPGFAEVIQEVDQTYSQQAVAVVDPDGFQYVLLAWYLKLAPKKYFSTVIMQQPDKIGLQYGQQVGRYHFIAAAEDRVQSEKVLVKWSGNKWQIKEF